MKPSWIGKGWLPCMVVILLFILWEISTYIFSIPKWLLPSPSAVFKEAFTSWPRLEEHIVATISVAAVGFVIAVLIGIGIAVLLHFVPLVKSAIYPLLILSQNIPIIAIAPLLIVWFGFGLLPKVIIIVLVCFFPIVIATLDGFLRTDPALLHYMKMSGATKWQTFVKLEVPYALPSFFSGLKISATYSVMGAVIAEWLGAEKGLGLFMTVASTAFRTDRVFVAILVIMILSMSTFGLIVLLEKWLIKWKPNQKR